MTGRVPRSGSWARRNGARLAAVAVAAVTVAAIAVPLVATSSPAFFSRYHLLNRRYVNLEDSAHEGIGCRVCHETDPLRNGSQLVGDFYVSMFTDEQSPRFFKFGSPKNYACLRCHRSDWSSSAERTGRIPHPAHTRVAAEKRPCTGCHKWTAHLEKYMTKHKKMPFSGVCVSYGCHVGTKQSEQCFDCHHVLHESATEWKVRHPETVALTGQNACLEQCHRISQCQLCHTTGRTPEFSGPAIRIGLDAIEKMHVRDDWTAKNHGPQALLDRDTCLLCHQSQGECQECHRYRPAFHGEATTWIGSHNKVTKRVDDPRCIECHEKKWCDGECHRKFKEME